MKIQIKRRKNAHVHTKTYVGAHFNVFTSVARFLHFIIFYLIRNCLNHGATITHAHSEAGFWRLRARSGKTQQVAAWPLKSCPRGGGGRRRVDIWVGATAASPLLNAQLARYLVEFCWLGSKQNRALREHERGGALNVVFSSPCDKGKDGVVSVPRPRPKQARASKMALL